REALRRWMPKAGPGKAQDQARGEHRPAGAPAPSSGAPAIDLGALTALFGDDTSFIREMLVEFCAASRTACSEIVAAVRERDAGGVGKAAHKLKGASRTAGANGLAVIGLGLEQAAKASHWAEIDRLAQQLDGESRRIEAFVAALS